MKFLFVALFAAAASAIAPLYTTRFKIDGVYLVILYDHADVNLILNIVTHGNADVASGALSVERVYRRIVKGFSVRVKGTFVLDRIRKLKGVEYVEEDSLILASAAEWGLDRIDQRDLPLDNEYNPKGNGSGVSVYILDTGINAGHSDFGGRAFTNKSMDFRSKPADGVDCNGHGTHMAGTIGGSLYGVAKSVTLYGVRVLGCKGRGSVSILMKGLNYVARMSGSRVAVVPPSLDVSITLDRAVFNLFNKGVPVITAAGNWKQDACNFSPGRSRYAYTVGATDSSDKIASFSNWGYCVDIYAPGVDVRTASFPSIMSGTSMASAHVAGAAAILRASLSWVEDIYGTLTFQGSINKISGVNRSSCPSNEYVDRVKLSPMTRYKCSRPNLLLYVG